MWYHKCTDIELKLISFAFIVETNFNDGLVIVDLRGWQKQQKLEK